jgi:large subunit ribosomal protein L17
MKRLNELSLLRNLIYSLILFGKIRTTKKRAKAVSKTIDGLVNKIKKGTLASEREVLNFLPKKELVEKLKSEIVPQLKERKSGYTRMARVGERLGDGSLLVMIEWAKDKEPVSTEEKPAEKEKLKEEKKVKKNDKTDKGR